MKRFNAFKLSVAALSLLSMLFATAQTHALQDEFTQRILPLNCVFTVVNNGTGQLVYVTPQACGVPVQTNDNSSTNSSNHVEPLNTNSGSNNNVAPNLKLIINKPKHMVITQSPTPNFVTQPNSQPNNLLPTILPKDIPKSNKPLDLTPILNQNVVQKFTITSFAGEVYTFPVLDNSGTSSVQTTYQTLTVDSINDKAKQPYAKITVSANYGAVNLTLHVGQTINLALNNKKVVDTAITLDAMNSKLVSLTIWQVQPLNSSSNPPETETQSNELAIVVMLGVAFATLFRPLQKNLLAKKR